MKRKIIGVPFKSWSMYHRNKGQKSDSLESARSVCMEKTFLIVKPSTLYASLFLVTINLKQITVDRRLSGSPDGADNFGPIFIPVHHYHHHNFYAIMNSISAVKRFILALSVFLCYICHGIFLRWTGLPGNRDYPPPPPI